MTLAELLAKIQALEAAHAAAEAGSATAVALKSQVDELQAKVKSLQDEAVLLAQKSTPAPQPANTSAQVSAFEAITSAYARVKTASPDALPSFKVKATLTVQGVGGAYTAPYNQPTYLPGISKAPSANLTFLDFIPVSPATADVIHEVRELAFVNGATWVLDGTAGGESSISFQEVSVSVKRVSTHLPISEKALANNDVAAITNSRLSEGLAVKRKARILGGAATAAEEFDGLLTSGNYVAYTPTAAVADFAALVNHLATKFDDVGGSMTELVLAPDLWDAVVNAKDSTGQPLYVANGTFIAGKSFKWAGSEGSSLTIFREKSLPAGKFLAANLGAATTYFARENTTIVVGQQGTDFVSHTCTIRAHEEGTLFVRKPYLIHYGTAFV